MSLYRFLPAFLVATAVAGAAGAQTTAPLPAPTVSDAAVPKHTCVRPGDVPGGLASDTQRRMWQKDYAAYSDCLKKFINDQRAAAEPYNKASNAAIDEYNSAVKYFNDQIEKLKEANK
jgi:hypothetical protein